MKFCFLHLTEILEIFMAQSFNYLIDINFHTKVERIVEFANSSLVIARSINEKNNNIITPIKKFLFIGIKSTHVIFNSFKL